MSLKHIASLKTAENILNNPVGTGFKPFPTKFKFWKFGFVSSFEFYELEIGVSSSGKTQVFGTWIRRFESSHPSQLFREWRVEGRPPTTFHFLLFEERFPWLRKGQGLGQEKISVG